MYVIYRNKKETLFKCKGIRKNILLMIMIYIHIIVRDSGNGETNEKIAYFSNPNFPFTDSEPNYATYTIKVIFY